jgi:hypothetical protein
MRDKVSVVGGDADSMKLYINTIIRKPCKTESCQNRAQNIKQTKAKQNRCAISRIDVLLGVPKGKKRKKDDAPSQERKKCPALIPAI